MGPLPRLLLLASLVWGAGAQRLRAPHPPGYRPQLDSYANLTKYTIDDPLALCNDGTPAAFYFAPASDNHGAASWLIYLEGGGWCFDDGSCMARFRDSPGLMSSAGWPESVLLTGIFDTDEKRNGWASSNKVFAGYCSSDAWVGASEQWFSGGGVSSFLFRGQRILTSLIEQLGGFGLPKATRVLFGGCSEGGRGAMASIDYLMPLFPAGADVRGFFDSAFELDVDVLDVQNAALSLQNQTAAALVYLNATGRMGTNCYTAFGDTALGWRCLYGQYRLGFLDAKWLASFSQFDSAQLVLAEGAPPPYGGDALLYADRFQTETRYQALQMPGAQQSGSAVFSSACFHHCTSNSGSFWGIHVDGASLASFATAWFFGGATAATRALANQPQLIESCNGFGCGQCHKAPTAVPNPPLPPARVGLRSAQAPYPSPPLSALQRALGITPASQQVAQQQQQHKEQALDSQTSTGYTELQLRTFHFFLFMLAMFALLAARLACRAARPSATERLAERKAGGGGAGRKAAAELTPLIAKGEEEDFGVFELPAKPPKAAASGAAAAAPPAAVGARFTRVAPVTRG